MGGRLPAIRQDKYICCPKSTSTSGQVSHVQAAIATTVATISMGPNFELKANLATMFDNRFTAEFPRGSGNAAWSRRSGQLARSVQEQGP